MTTFAQPPSSAPEFPDEPDLGRLRSATGARLRAAMADRGVEAMVLLGNSNVVLASCDYVGVGARIPAATSFLDDARAVLRAARFLVQPKKNVEEYIQVLGLSHSIDTGSGYDTLICEPGCAPTHHVV